MHDTQAEPGPSSAQKEALASILAHHAGGGAVLCRAGIALYMAQRVLNGTLRIDAMPSAEAFLIRATLADAARDFASWAHEHEVLYATTHELAQEGLLKMVNRLDEMSPGELLDAIRREADRNDAMLNGLTVARRRATALWAAFAAAVALAAGIWLGRASSAEPATGVSEEAHALAIRDVRQQIIALSEHLLELKREVRSVQEAPTPVGETR